MVNLYGISNALTAVTSFAMCVLVAGKGGKVRLGRIWAVFAANVAIYGFGAFMASGAPDSSKAYFWWQVSYVGVIMLPPLFLHFVYAFLDLRKYYLLIAVYAVSFVVLAADVFIPGLFIGNVSMKFPDLRFFTPAWWVYPPGPLHVFYVIAMYTGILIYAHYLLLRSYRSSPLRKRNQIHYFFTATALGFLGGGSSYLPCYGVNIYPVLNILVPVYPIIMTYAIIRHQLMDITIIIKKTLIFGLLFAITFGIFVAVTLLTQQLISGNRLGVKFAGLGVSALLIILAMRPLENILVRATDKFLFQKKYDYKHLLRTFSDDVLTVLGLTELVSMTVSKLADIMKLECASILLYDEEAEEFRMAASSSGNMVERVIDGNDKLITYMRSTGRYVLFDEFGAKEGFGGGGHFEVYAREMSAAMLVPLIYMDKITGVLILCNKKSDEEFTHDDISVILPLARTLSIAITNARLFEKLSAAQEMAAQQEKMAVIGTLSAGINHEICNPLGIARGQCEMFLLNMNEGLYKNKTHEELMLKAQEIMMKVIRETDRATSITRKLSAFAKPAKGNVRDRVDIREELKEVMALLEHDLQLDKITIFTDIENNLPAIMADKKQIQEIFFNIIRNAAQAINASGQITIRAFSLGKNVHIDIKDTGAGINKKHLGQIFDPFFTTKDPGRGTGLGLFIVKQVVERNGGEISVQSEIGKGTNFRLVFSAAALPSG